MGRRIRVFASWRKKRVAVIMTLIMSAAGIYACWRIYPKIGMVMEYFGYRE